MEIYIKVLFSFTFEMALLETWKFNQRHLMVKAVISFGISASVHGDHAVVGAMPMVPMHTI